MSAKFTPAPWNTYRGSVWSTNPAIDKSQRTNMVCSISERWKMPEEEKEANAKLISAAPDLYEALEKIMPYFKVIRQSVSGAALDCLENEARAALAKVGEA